MHPLLLVLVQYWLCLLFSYLLPPLPSFVFLPFSSLLVLLQSGVSVLFSLSLPSLLASIRVDAREVDGSLGSAIDLAPAWAWNIFHSPATRSCLAPDALCMKRVHAPERD